MPSDHAPSFDEYIFIKPHYSAFYETPLNSLLGYLKIENLILTGVAGNICGLIKMYSSKLGAILWIIFSLYSFVQ
ncbi:isochorismatase family protein [Bacillus sp. HC-TM]